MALALITTAMAACGNRASLDANRDGRYSANELYVKAADSMDKSNFRRAIQLYQILETRFPFSEYARQAQLDMMYAQYRANQPESAIEGAERFIREHPRHEKVDYAYYIRGLANFPSEIDPLEKLFRVSPYSRPQDQAEKSFEAFATMLEKFPDSEWAPDARQRMVWLRDAMAYYELEVANYYMRRGAYIAAANRTRRVIEEFPESAAVLDALRVQIRAYNLLDLGDLAADTQRVLDENLSLRQP